MSALIFMLALLCYSSYCSAWCPVGAILTYHVETVVLQHNAANCCAQLQACASNQNISTMAVMQLKRDVAFIKKKKNAVFSLVRFEPAVSQQSISKPLIWDEQLLKFAR
jgi:hypothetical protein